MRICIVIPLLFILGCGVQHKDERIIMDTGYDIYADLARIQETYDPFYKEAEDAYMVEHWENYDGSEPDIVPDTGFYGVPKEKEYHRPEGIAESPDISENDRQKMLRLMNIIRAKLGDDVSEEDMVRFYHAVTRKTGSTEEGLYDSIKF